MLALLIVLAAFGGISLVIATVATAILLANGKITLPNTNMRRIQQARVNLELAKFALEREQVQYQHDNTIQLRLEQTTGGDQ